MIPGGSVLNFGPRRSIMGLRGLPHGLHEQIRQTLAPGVAQMQAIRDNFKQFHPASVQFEVTVMHELREQFFKIENRALTMVGAMIGNGIVQFVQHWLSRWNQARDVSQYD